MRSVWLRHDLESFKKRLSALEKHIAETGEILTEAQVVALERKQDDDVAVGEIETAHPGYLGIQDTFYVGTIKGVGRIYQQTFVIPIRRSLQLSYTVPKSRLRLLTCSMTWYCRSLPNTKWA